MWARDSSPVFAPAIPLRGLGSTVATVRPLAGGNAGTVDTLAYMREFVKGSLTSPQQQVRETALGLVSNLAARDWMSEIHALHRFVRDEIRYVMDPDEFETVQTPEKTLQYRAGDCDDKATLLAALLKSIGHPARFVAVGIRGGSFSHVLVETQIGEQWCPAETILPVPLGWYPPDATKRYTMRV